MFFDVTVGAGGASIPLPEGHAAFVSLELARREYSGNGSLGAALEIAQKRTVFTTHTPVPAGHDRFPLDLARGVLGAARVNALEVLGCCDSELNMTRVGLTLSQQPPIRTSAYPCQAKTGPPIRSSVLGVAKWLVTSAKNVPGARWILSRTCRTGYPFATTCSQRPMRR